MSNVWDRYRDKRIVYQSSIRAARYGATGSYSLQEWLDICVKCDFKCIVCGEKKPLTADHIIPLSKGGSNNIENIQPLCKPCNSRKHNKLPENLTVPQQSLPLTLQDALKRFRAHARHRLIIDVEAARKLDILTRYNRPDLTVDQFVEHLIEQSWDETEKRPSCEKR